MKFTTITAAFLFAALSLCALALSSSAAAHVAAPAGNLGIKWAAPTSCLRGAGYSVHIELTAPAGGTVVSGWLLTPAAFNIDGKALAAREEKGSMALPEGAKIIADVDIGPYLHVEKDFQLIKSVVELRPFYHHTDVKARAHVSLCMLALLLERLLESRLEAGGRSMTADACLSELRSCNLNRYQAHELSR